MGVIQIRDVPEDVHDMLRRRAAVMDVSLSEYLRDMLARSARRPTPDELDEMLRRDGPADLGEPSEVAVRHIRDHGE
jgi:plasmid stability protein